MISIFLWGESVYVAGLTFLLLEDPVPASQCVISRRTQRWRGKRGGGSAATRAREDPLAFKRSLQEGGERLHSTLIGDLSGPRGEEISTFTGLRTMVKGKQEKAHSPGRWPLGRRSWKLEAGKEQGVPLRGKPSISRGHRPGKKLSEFSAGSQRLPHERRNVRRGSNRSQDLKQHEKESVCLYEEGGASRETRLRGQATRQRSGYD